MGTSTYTGISSYNRNNNSSKKKTQTSKNEQNIPIELIESNKTPISNDGFVNHREVEINISPSSQQHQIQQMRQNDFQHQQRQQNEQHHYLPPAPLPQEPVHPPPPKGPPVLIPLLPM